MWMSSAIRSSGGSAVAERERVPARDEVLALRAGERAALHRAGLSDERRRSEVERGAERLDRRRGERVAARVGGDAAEPRLERPSLAARRDGAEERVARGRASRCDRARDQPVEGHADVLRGHLRVEARDDAAAARALEQEAGLAPHGHEDPRPGDADALGHAVALVPCQAAARQSGGRERGDGGEEREAERGHTSLRNQRADRTAPARMRTSAAAVTATVISFQRFSCRSREPRSLVDPLQVSGGRRGEEMCRRSAWRGPAGPAGRREPGPARCSRPGAGCRGSRRASRAERSRWGCRPCAPRRQRPGGASLACVLGAVREHRIATGGCGWPGLFGPTALRATFTAASSRRRAPSRAGSPSGSRPPSRRAGTSAADGPPHGSRT